MTHSGSCLQSRRETGGIAASSLGSVAMDGGHASQWLHLRLLGLVEHDLQRSSYRLS